MSILAGLLICLSGLRNLGPSTGYDLKLDGEGLYKRTIFVGVAVDVETGTDGDRFQKAVGAFREILVEGCDQNMAQPSDLLLGPRATAEAVRNKLTSLATSAGVDDRVLVDICSHGVERNGEPMFRLSGPEGKGESFLSMAQVKSLFLKIPSRHKVLIVDGCNSKSFLDKSLSWNPPERPKDAVGKKCALIVVSPDALKDGREPQSKIGGTELHDRLLKELNDPDKGLLKRGEVTTFRAIHQRMYFPCGAFENGVSDVVLAGEESKKPGSPESKDYFKVSPTDEQKAKSALARYDKMREASKANLEASKATLAETNRRSVKSLTLLSPIEVYAEIAKAEKWGEDALATYTSEDSPREFAEIHSDLAYCWWKVARGVGTIKDLDRAEAHYVAAAAALGKHKEDFFSLWSLTQNCLANVFTERGEKTGSVPSLHQAVSLFRVLAKECKEHNMLVDYARVQVNLANALQYITNRTSDYSRLQEQEDAYKSALAELRQVFPIEWAIVKNNLGCLLRTKGQMEANGLSLDEAIECFNEALPVFKKVNNAAGCAMVVNNRGVAEVILSRKTKDPVKALDHSKNAERDFELADGVFGTNKSEAPYDWVMLQSNLGEVRLDLGRRQKDRSKLEASVVHFEAAIEKRAELKMSLECGKDSYNLGQAYEELEEKAKAIRAYEAAIRYFKEAPNTGPFVSVCQARIKALSGTP